MIFLFKILISESSYFLLIYSKVRTLFLQDGEVRGSEETVCALDAPDDSTNFHDLHGVAGRRVRRVVRWGRLAALPDTSVRRRHDVACLGVIEGERSQEVVMLSTDLRERVVPKRLPAVGIEADDDAERLR
jgi:hypothetical protein